jgi:hypothetical protein
MTMASVYENGARIKRRRETMEFSRTLRTSPIKAPPKVALDMVADVVEGTRARIALLTGFDVSKVTLQVEFVE